MKINPIILIIVIISGIYIGLKINDTQFNSMSSDTKSTKDKIEKVSSSPNLSPEFIMDYLSENGFDILPIYKGTRSDIYSGAMSISDSDIKIQVDVYQERSSDKILLIETNIDAISYYSTTNQKEIENVVNEVASKFFVPLVQMPYDGSNPEKAAKWVDSKILTSYSEKPKEKTSTKIGTATINIFGDQYFRTLEIDFGFADQSK